MKKKTLFPFEMATGMHINLMGSGISGIKTFKLE